MTRTRTARLTGARLDAAARYLWTSGRVLEQRRFAHLFGVEGGPAGGVTGVPAGVPTGDPAGVLAALDAHRTADGGYAYGLEPDVRGPAAQPIAVPAALLVLEEAGALDHARARAVCDWLAGVAAPDGGVPVVLPSLRPYPHPPFVPVPEEGEPPVGALLSTGQTVAPLLRRGIVHPWLTAATAFCRTAVENLRETHPYEAGAAIRFLDAAPDTAWARREAARLGALVHEQRIVLLDPARPEEARVSPGYAPGEHHLPHDYARRPDSLARRWFTTAELARGLDHLAAEQQSDGGWPIHWVRWSASTESEARPGVTLQALLTLRAYDAPEDV
ncbi:hypothetical protein OG401_09130 [Kitasatospora purpeofusca]|uniref:hypothetical protein n=1 Tax=Kitasatospora purpeofusca TaxID=67352 RepID=UPI00224E31E5|nr:hypothetical protein [Kitasatospora purpeofusca]MCX4684476.1 hypothetical protein [Kitasatospora purpeofusca]